MKELLAPDSIRHIESHPPDRKRVEETAYFLWKNRENLRERGIEVGELPNQAVEDWETAETIEAHKEMRDLG